MTISLAKPNAYIVIINGDGEVIAAEPKPATGADLEALEVEAFSHCLTTRNITATNGEQAMATARAEIAAETNGMAHTTLDRI